MLISCNRLKKYIKDCEDIDWLRIWDEFTIRVAEVENVKIVGNTFDDVVVGEIKECVMHPDSDHMHILKVDIGSDIVQIVCGAPNVRVGLKTAIVKEKGHIDGYEITTKKLRGVESHGMCCSFKELGIGDNHDGIIELPINAPVGMDIKKYLPIEDIIVEIDNKSLTNRPDLWGHYGISREICALTGHKMIPLAIEEVKNNKKDLNIKIKDSDLCYRYCGLKVDNIENNKTPMDMQIFLNYVGMRSISLIVDLTNFVMLELGQPMHAFSANIVNSVEVDALKKEIKFKTLDGVERNIPKNTLMIKNDDKYFAIAGIMGGYSSEITNDTDSIFLESATFDAASIRKTAIHIGLRTEASARYEKSLDPNLAIIALKRILYLLKQENPNLEIASNLTDVYPKPLKEGKIKLPKDLLNKYLGFVLDSKKVISILESLEFEVCEYDLYYDVTVPTFRHTKDIFIAQDLIEEIARIYGLENFEPKPLKLDLTIKEHETIFNQEYEIKKLLATKYNLHEVHSYIWYDSNLLKELGIEKDGVKLLGKSENNILRDDMSLSLLNIVNTNLKNYHKCGIFEIGTIIKDNNNKKVLSIILADDEKNIDNLYCQIKNIVGYLFSVLKNKDIIINNNLNCKPYYEKKLAKDIFIDDKCIGNINVLKKMLTNKIAKKKVIVMADVDFSMYHEIKYNKIISEEVSKYPLVELDYTIIMNDKKYGDLKQILSMFHSNIGKEWYLLGIYKNKYTIRYVIGDDNKTLEQKDIQEFKEIFINHIKKNGLDIIE